MNYKAILLAVITSVLATILTDINAYTKSREENKDAQFDWGLFTARLAKGVTVGILTGLGGGYISGSPTP